MNPQMQKQLDEVCTFCAEKFSTTPTVINLFVASTLLATKLLVLGNNLSDKKIDTKQTMNSLANEVVTLTIIACQFLTPPWEGKKVVEVQTYVTNKVSPIINFFYFGMDPSDQKEETGIIIAKH